MTPTVDELWLRSLQKLTAHIAHDLKGALNGASVNLEVVRSRSEKESSTVADVHRFAVTAADQLGVVIRTTGGLLALGRAQRGPVEVSTVCRQVANLLADMRPSGSGALEVIVEGGLAAETSAPLNAVRLAIAECVLAATSGNEAVVVLVQGLPVPCVQVSPTSDPRLEPEVRSALADAGIRVGMDGHGISIMLPRPAETPTEEA